MTTQVNEQIIIDGKEYPLINCPPLPEDDSIIQRNSNGLYEKSTACHRGYVGYWEIKNDKLYLIDFSSPNYELIENPPIFADWVTYEVKIATGEIIETSSWAIETYETEMHLTIENGLVIKTENIKND